MAVSLFHLCIFLLFIQTSARRLAEEYGNPTSSPPPQPALKGGHGHIRPGITAIVASITTIFTITFILLVYVQHCKTGRLAANSRASNPLSRVDSGVNKKVIQQLPLFRFSSLRGQKDGLECSVCLTRFDTEDVLRLLPKCRHAFHVDCVDTWLDEHSTCPLCRYRVRPEDVLLIDCHGSNHKALYNYAHGAADSRRGNLMGPGMFSGRHSFAGDRRTGSADRLRNESSRRRCSFDNSRSSRRGMAGTPAFSRKNFSRRDERMAVQGDKHRLEHQIVVSEGRQAEEGKNKAKEQDEMLFLSAELLLDGGEGDEEEGSGSSRVSIDDGSAAAGMRKNKSDVGGSKGKEKREEGIEKRWLEWIPQFQHKPSANAASSSSSDQKASSSH